MVVPAVRAGFSSRAFVSSPILILRGLHDVPGTRVWNEPRPAREKGEKGDASQAEEGFFTKRSSTFVRDEVVENVRNSPIVPFRFAPFIVGARALHFALMK